MRPLFAVLASLAAALLLASCANPQATLKAVAYGDPTKPYLGMSKEEILACAGAPHAKYPIGAAAETLTYHYSGAGPVPAEAKPDKKKSDENKSEEKKKGGLFGGIEKKGVKDWTCTASLVFENDRLVRVNFAHKDVESPYAYQAKKDKAGNEAKPPEEIKTCVFSLPRCLR